MLALRLLPAAEAAARSRTLMTMARTSCAARDMQVVEVNGNRNIARLLAQSAVQVCLWGMCEGVRAIFGLCFARPPLPHGAAWGITVYGVGWAGIIMHSLPRRILRAKLHPNILRCIWALPGDTPRGLP